MDNHPIPQDITGFKFKLFGPMTVKQFGYVAVGAVSAWLIYMLPIIVFIKVPLEIGLAGFGVALAFLPVAGRPLDSMIKNFFIAIFNPTKYVYQKDTGLAEEQSPAPATSAKLTGFLGYLPFWKKTATQNETMRMGGLRAYQPPQNNQPAPGFVPPHVFSTQQTSSSSQAQPIAPAAPKTEPVQKPAVDSATQTKNEELLKKEVSVPQKTDDKSTEKTNGQKEEPKNYLEAHQKVLDLQNNLSNVLSQKQQLEEMLVALQKKLDTQTSAALPASMLSEAPKKELGSVRSVPNSQAKSVGFATNPEYPNIITGIIKDPRGNPLPNILVEVKDKEGNAVRAFKTNPLGQFASATPLVNGDYVIEFEDPRAQNKFEAVTFKANGEIILPIEIISVDTREELRRSLFN